jgi:hypothetical protein
MKVDRTLQTPDEHIGVNRKVIEGNQQELKLTPKMNFRAKFQAVEMIVGNIDSALKISDVFEELGGKGHNQ